MTTPAIDDTMRTIIVDDEPLAVERLRAVCAKMPQLEIVDTAADGVQALDRIARLRPDLVLLDMTMPELDGLAVARRLADDAAKNDYRPAVIFVTAHDHFAVAAFDLDAVDYVLKPVAADRLARAVERATARRGEGGRNGDQYGGQHGSRRDSPWLEELWVPHRSELLRIDIAQVSRVDAERDYVRLHVGDDNYLLLQTIAGLEKQLDPTAFIRIHRSTILRRDTIRGLRHDGLGAWSVDLGPDRESLRIGRTFLPKVKAMAGR
ncbi:MAG: LytTR family DNA-binding domain-containing protein [Pontixanthobacter sp.]